MTSATKRIRVTKSTSLDDVLREAASGPLILEADERAYLIKPAASGPGWEDYDPARLVATLNAMAGLLPEAEADAEIARIYAERRAG